MNSEKRSQNCSTPRSHNVKVFSSHDWLAVTEDPDAGRKGKALMRVFQEANMWGPGYWWLHSESKLHCQCWPLSRPPAILDWRVEQRQRSIAQKEEVCMIFAIPLLSSGCTVLNLTNHPLKGEAERDRAAATAAGHTLTGQTARTWIRSNGKSNASLEGELSSHHAMVPRHAAPSSQ
jgi:hypothetical protein